MMGVSPKTVHVWLADPDGSVARERKRRYHDGVCRDCGDPCYRYWSHWQGGHTAWRCQKCERRRLHELRKWITTGRPCCPEGNGFGMWQVSWRAGSGTALGLVQPEVAGPPSSWISAPVLAWSD